MNFKTGALILGLTTAIGVTQFEKTDAERTDKGAIPTEIREDPKGGAKFQRIDRKEDIVQGGNPNSGSVVLRQAGNFSLKIERILSDIPNERQALAGKLIEKNNQIRKEIIHRNWEKIQAIQNNIQVIEKQIQAGETNPALGEVMIQSHNDTIEEIIKETLREIIKQNYLLQSYLEKLQAS